MKKTELTKEQQKKFKWLMDADTLNEDVEVIDNVLIWENGTWKDGKMWCNLKQKFVKVKWNGKEFKEIN